MTLGLRRLSGLSFSGRTWRVWFGRRRSSVQLHNGLFHAFYGCRGCAESHVVEIGDSGLQPVVRSDPFSKLPVVSMKCNSAPY